MNPHEPDDSEGDWVKRYRQASEAEAPMPSSAAREAILTEGRRVAAERAANPTTHLFDPKQRAANQSRWKLAAVGTVGAALFAAVLMYSHVGAPPIPPAAEMAATSPSVPAPATAAKKQAEEPVEEVVVSAGRQVPRPPARTSARRTQSAPSSSAARLDSSADAAFREPRDAPNNIVAGAQGGRAAPSTSAAPPSLEALSIGSSTLPMEPPLVSSVMSGDLARATELLNHGENPDTVDSLGRTPLLLAVITHRVDLVELLLAHHADPNAADQAGEMPLQRARMDDQPNIVRLLKRAGAR
jgi:ankyrin repeat protein